MKELIEGYRLNGKEGKEYAIFKQILSDNKGKEDSHAPITQEMIDKAANKINKE